MCNVYRLLAGVLAITGDGPRPLSGPANRSGHSARKNRGLAPIFFAHLAPVAPVPVAVTRVGVVRARCDYHGPRRRRRVDHGSRFDRGDHAAAQSGACGKNCDECFHGAIKAGAAPPGMQAL